MALPASSTTFLTIGIGALVVWRIYSRIRRMLGRQKFSGVRAWITIALFPSLLVFLLFSSLSDPVNALVLLLGAVVGAALGLYGLRLTVFEDQPAGKFYTPNAHLGIALSVLLFGRIAYRLVQQYGLMASSAAMPEDFLRSPITLLIFGTLAAYYVSYAIGLLRWQCSLRVRDSSPSQLHS
ncbi:hypothetical protein [Undibacterium sp. Ren11W]|uniref:hypothetical protein n=1 Tax=Undibacterium sp. Ren11W TaxID=3413045 RepID=UPI003BF1A41A